MFKHLLVPTDGSELSQSTVRRAVSFAKETGAKITFFYAQPDFPMISYTEAIVVNPTPDEFLLSTQKEAQRVLDLAKGVADEQHVDCDVGTTVDDFPYRAIIAAAGLHQCDLIFMASHGRGGFMGLLLGSETQKVLTHSSVPVLVYR